MTRRFHLDTNYLMAHLESMAKGTQTDQSRLANGVIGNLKAPPVVSDLVAGELVKKCAEKSFAFCLDDFVAEMRNGRLLFWGPEKKELRQYHSVVRELLHVDGMLGAGDYRILALH